MQQAQNTTSETGEMPLKNVRDLLGKNYYIPNYQRGYRWGKDEVTKLLDDIWDFANHRKSQFYCLQPLIILPQEPSDAEETVRYEVLDGQQRLTTLNLIVHYIKEHFPGNEKYPEMYLHYQTRPESSKAFSSICIGEDGRVRMEDGLKPSIDFWHIKHAYGHIHSWFSEKEEDDRFNGNTFQEVFLDQVKVIWYEIDRGEDPIKVFERNNIGKIPLADAELIKAFILKGDKRSDRNHLRRQLEIAREWDEIEQGLRNPNLWAFIFGNKPMPDICIGQLFVVALKLEDEKKPKVYDIVEKKLEEKEGYLESLWQRVKDLYSMIVDWYHDHKAYHYIGYLTQMGVKVQSIYALRSEDDTKAQFIDKLRSKISEGEIRKLHYSQKDGFYKLSKREKSKELYGGKEVRSLLLLYNIELCLREGSTERFPFETLQVEGEKRIMWDIEHIDSQTPREIQSKKEQNQWLEVTREALGSKIDETLGESIEKYIAQELNEQEKFEALREQLQDLAGEKEDNYSQSIGNLALLDAETNRSYGNSLFIKKRAELQKREQQGKFIPQGTKIAFMKYFPGSRPALDKWSTEDKCAHEAYIYDLVKDYIKNK
ncbi:DUF262 domain-containing protein [Porphyromonas bobii]|jgi:hypothetical protein|uniref:DUF262 domain-containing protein n=1 Tax=Porphyromonas bobii TaxID=2811780 RepID=UPI001C008152|nr:DUF262 domain-containing protein [Porphyromonas bobii]